MTGYGIGEISADGRRISVEIKSVNNRFLDVNLRTPRSLNPHEGKLRKLIGKRLSRGRVSVQVLETWEKESSPKISINLARAKNYVDSLRQVARELDINSDVSLDNLLATGDLFESEEDTEYRDKLWELTSTACNIALDALIEVSLKEGKNLSVDLHERLDQIISERKMIDKYAHGQMKVYAERLKARLGDLFDDARIDPTRLETELAISADKLDISEEIVRLNSHIDIFQDTLDNKKAPGKALGFILQEMGREANTIASKSWLIEISQSSMRIKEILEQIREQVKNIE
jgi:uncharacterized protein (TIGR00255 family)